MKVATLDLGSNTFLCLICEVDKTTTGNIQITKTYYDDVTIVRLGQGLSENKNFHIDALARAKTALQDFKKQIDLHQPEQVLAMATSAARDAENKEELFKICRDLEIPLEIIPGNKEAEITYQGSVAGQTEVKDRLVVDIGGGSTEFIFGTGEKLLFGQSFDIGCVRLTEKMISAQPTSDIEIKKCREYISEVMSSLKAKAPFVPAVILAVAGTPTALAVADVGKFDPKIIDGYKISLEKLNQWLEKLQHSTVAEKISFGIPAGRADVILIGVIILIEALNLFNKEEIIVSTKGVRHGIALELARRIS